MVSSYPFQLSNIIATLDNVIKPHIFLFSVVDDYLQVSSYYVQYVDYLSINV